MTQKILIAYATKRGSTTDVVQAIADVLRDGGADVDVKFAKDVKNIDGYDAVIVGSAIRMGNVLGEVKRFVSAHRAALRRVPVAYFTVGLMINSDDPEQRAQALHYLDPLKEQVAPVADANFAGKIARPTLNLMERFIMNMTQAEDMDNRDWDAIRTWAVDVQGKLPVLA